MIAISHSAFVALRNDLEEFREYREDPVILLHVHPNHADKLNASGWSSMEIEIGRPHSCVFPRKGVFKAVHGVFEAIEGLDVCLFPNLLTGLNVNVSLREGYIWLTVTRSEAV